MKYRAFGKTGLKVSALGFGAMRLPVLPANPRKPKAAKVVDKDEAVAIIRRAIDQGVNYVDTAYGYHGGESERIVGMALQDGYRAKTFVATKFPCWKWKREGDFGRILNTQLKRLQTDSIDFYLLHALGAETWKNVVLAHGLIEKMVEARDAGKIRHIGFSFHDSLDVFKAIVDYTDVWEFCQIQLNYLDTEFQAGLAGLRHASARGLAVIAMEPLQGGNLANLPPKAARVFKDTARTPVEWGFDFLWNMPEVSMLLSGMGSRQMVDEDVAYASRARVGMLRPADVAVIAQARQTMQGADTIPCTACEYCLPCPHGVAIPYNFRAYNNLFKGKAKAECEAQYANWVPMFGHRADACVGCRACEPKCPQHIAIADRMKDVAAAFA